jgi:hypothetical protein
MKKITLLLLMLGFTSFISAQCLTATNGQYPFSGDTNVPFATQVCDGLTENVITIYGFAGEYSAVAVVSGETYTFSSSNATDIVTISSDSGVTAAAYGIGSVTWVSNITGEIWFYTNLDDGTCGSESIDRTRSFVCGAPPSCIAPTGLVFSNIATISATVSWTASTTVPANGYEYFLSNTNTAPTASSVASGSVGAGILTANLTSLTLDTAYYVWVRSICSSSDSSSWSSVANFKTLCNSVTNFTENFDAAVAFPACWARVGTGGNTYVQASTSAPSQPNNLYLYGTSTIGKGVVAMIPVSNAGAGTHRLRFKARANFTIGGNIEVGYLTNPSDATSFVSIQTFTTTSLSVYDSFSAILGTTPGTNQVLAFRHTGVPSNSVLIDDVVWEQLPSCVEPSTLAVSGITSTGANLSWTASVSAPSGYEYVLDNLATDPTAAGTSISALTYTATALAPVTTYYFHLRSNCSVGLNSAWITSMFTTLPTPPANDDCSNAVTLTPGGVFGDNIQSGTIYGATLTSGITPSCQALFNSDVWYKVVVPASGSITIETQVDATNSMTDTVVAAFSGTCGSLNQIGCDDDGGPTGANSNMSILSLTALNPGTTIYVGVWKYAVAAPATTNSQFKISAYDASLASATFANSNFTFYPNPVKDVLNISNSTVISKVQVVNLLGQEMIVKSMNETQGQVDMSQLSTGTYLVKVTSDNQVKTIKVIKE